MTTEVVYLDTRTDKGIMKFLDMVSGERTLMWLHEQEGEDNRGRAESPSRGKLSSTIEELVGAIGVELLEIVVGHDTDEEIKDDIPPVQGIPEAA